MPKFNSYSSRQRTAVIYLTNQGYIRPFIRSSEVSISHGVKIFTISYSGLAFTAGNQPKQFDFSTKATSYKEALFIINNQLLDYFHEIIDFVRPTPFNADFDRNIRRIIDQICDRSNCKCPEEKGPYHSCFRFRRTTKLEYQLSTIKDCESTD